MSNNPIHTIPHTAQDRTQLRVLINAFVSHQPLCPLLSLNNISSLAEHHIEPTHKGGDDGGVE